MLSVELAFLLATGATAVHAQTNAVSLKLDDESLKLLRDLVAYTQTNTLSVRVDDETRNLLRGIKEDKWFKKENFASTVLGGALAMAAGLAASLCAQWLKARHEKRKEAEFASNVLRAIRRELEALGDIYKKAIGGELAQAVPGRILRTRFAFSQNYLTVFEANAIHVGRLDGPISRRIITVYVLLKSLVEDLRVNNSYLDMLDSVDTGRHIINYPPRTQAQRAEVERWLVKHCELLKVHEKNLKAEVEALFQSLDKIGIH